MILLIPYTRFTLKTYMSAYEAEQRLAAHVEPRKMRWGLSRNHKFFQGTVESSKFNIERIIDYRNSFHPIIVGQIQDGLDTRRIEVKMRLSRLFIAFLAIFVGFFFISGAPTQSHFLTFLILWLFYVISMIFYNYEVNKARRHLEEIFQVSVADF